ncbi:histidine kinase internal region (plasmid) [Gemmatirosa kalamazoonensis]|uniref:Histidine kinase internal region n=1 Tax=Gemmatirosa kalamazoonensis TaxID=861299 RepID=W0RT47_9BACT|nr:histidine kinase [Gemmatirosa kalamazoonensis]AHG92733.1 histidine kinase internal region [Gemmatirosa kalamazoonensis]
MTTLDVISLAVPPNAVRATGEPDAAAGGWDTPGEWLRLWGYAFVAYTALTILATTSSALNELRLGAPIDLPRLVGHRALEEYTCAVFVPPLFWLVHRFPIDRRRWRRSAPILLAASLLCVVVKYVAVYLPLARLAFPSDRPTLSAVLTLYAVEVLSDFLGVIGVAHAIEYYRRAQSRERLAAELRARLSEAQLQSLRSQLHPHFLFNALNGVATLMHQDVHAADRMVTNLAGLLRAALDHADAHEIPLAEELGLLERYLAIVSARFHDRLTVAYRIAPDVYDALVPQFLLQPLAENAVEHGIARRAGPGTITIGAERAGDAVVLTVGDDGPGGRGDRPRGERPRAGGIGLANTRARLRELYGPDCALDLETAAGRGACVTIRVPYRRAGAQEAV